MLDEEDVLLALLAEIKLSLVIPINRHREENIFQINSCTRGARRCAHLLKQHNHIWSSSCSWTCHLVK